MEALTYNDLKEGIWYTADSVEYPEQHWLFRFHNVTSEGNLITFECINIPSGGRYNPGRLGRKMTNIQPASWKQINEFYPEEAKKLISLPLSYEIY